MADPIFDTLPDCIRIRDLRGDIDTDLVCDLSDELRSAQVVICFNGGINSDQGFTVIKGAGLLETAVKSGRTITTKLMGYQTKSFEQTHVLAALLMPGFDRTRLLKRPGVVERIKDDLLNPPPFDYERKTLTKDAKASVIEHEESLTVTIDASSGVVLDGSHRFGAIKQLLHKD